MFCAVSTLPRRKTLKRTREGRNILEENLRESNRNVQSAVLSKLVVDHQTAEKGMPLKPRLFKAGKQDLFNRQFGTAWHQLRLYANFSFGSVDLNDLARLGPS